MSGLEPDDACSDCLARTWLLTRLGAHLEQARARILTLLELPERELIAAVAGDSAAEVNRELAAFDAAAARERAERAGLETICRHDSRYPQALAELEAPPAVLHIAGGASDALVRTAEADPVAIVGSRRAGAYGLQVAGTLARGLALAGVPVISGMALGIDSAAHEGALRADAGAPLAPEAPPRGGATTLAVMPAGAERPYPASKRRLHQRILTQGLVVSELPPGARVWRWAFPARNRIVAALAAMTVVVEAGSRSGALITARLAAELGRPVGAVPGRVTTSGASGPHRLIAEGARLISEPQDVLDAIFGAGIRRVPADDHEALSAPMRSLLREIAEGRDTPTALERAGLGPERGLATLAALELAGYVLREPGGSFAAVVAPR